MKPKVLADAMVEAGLINRDSRVISLYWALPSSHPQPANHIVEDWRVAGKVLESMRSFDVDRDDGWVISVWMNGSFTGPGATVGNESLPRAIIEAWYEATEQGESDA